jgi:Fic family protein
MNPFIPQTLPIKNLDWQVFIPFIGPASAALARYDGMLQAIINPKVLLSPLTTQEAVLSSQIEGTQATIEEVLAFEGADQKPAEPQKEGDIKEILNYRRAMNYAVEELKNRPINLNLINKVHYILLEDVRGKDKARGQFRKIQNWIGAPGTQMEKAKYIPPKPENVPDSMSNLEKYIHSPEIDMLVQLAIVHAQFEIIHPYIDGNGRVGRIFIPLYLYEKKILSSPMFYLSAYLEAHRAEYYDRLNNITQKNGWTGWILFFLKALIEQAKANTDKAKAVLNLYQVKKEKIAKLTRSQYAIKVVDTLFKNPIFTTPRFIAESAMSKESASRIIGSLYRNQVLSLIRKGSGRQPSVYIFNKLIEIIKT